MSFDGSEWVRVTHCVVLHATPRPQLHADRRAATTIGGAVEKAKALCLSLALLAGTGARTQKMWLHEVLLVSYRILNNKWY